MITLKTNVVLENADIRETMSEVDRYLETQTISKKEKTHMRLLTEEALSILRATVKEGHGELTIEPVNEEYAISLEVNSIVVGGKSKERLIDVSSKNKNEYYRGFTGKIRQAFEWLLSGGDYAESAYLPMMNDREFVGTSYGMQWSYQAFKKNVAKEDNEQKDELERSILSKLAKEVLVGASDRTVFMKIFYQTKK